MLRSFINVAISIPMSTTLLSYPSLNAEKTGELKNSDDSRTSNIFISDKEVLYTANEVPKTRGIGAMIWRNVSIPSTIAGACHWAGDDLGFNPCHWQWGVLATESPAKRFGKYGVYKIYVPGRIVAWEPMNSRSYGQGYWKVTYRKQVAYE